MRVFVDAANVTAAGPRAVAAGLLPALARIAGADALTLLAADGLDTDGIASRGGRILTVPRRHGIRNDAARVAHLAGGLARRVRRANTDVVLTLGDVAAVVGSPHVVFVHNALYAYPDGVASPQGAAGRLRWRAMRRLFDRGVRHAAAVVVQTPVMAERLAERGVVRPERLHVIAQPPPNVGRDVAGQAARRVAASDAACRLLFLAAGYRHKNHALLPAVVAELRRRGMHDTVRLFVTLPPDDPAWRAVAGACEPVVVNLGVIPPHEVGGALRASSALFLPTLIESYGLVYLEALAAGAGVVTSDRPFARYMCGAAAEYFDPHDASAVVDAIERFASRAPGAPAADASAQLSRFPATWAETAQRFLEVLRAASV